MECKELLKHHNEERARYLNRHFTKEDNMGGKQAHGKILLGDSGNAN